MKKVIHSSNLALRFYLSAGWTREDLKKFLIEGDGDITCKDHGTDWAYFIYSPYSQVDVDKLLEGCSKVIRAFDDYPSQTDREFCLQHLWP